MQERFTQTPAATQAPRVTCPCCHGEQKLEIDDALQASGVLIVPCLYCLDGTVPSELEQPVVVNKFQVTVEPSLQRNQLSVEAKRDHLRGLRMNEDDIEKIIREIYP